MKAQWEVITEGVERFVFLAKDDLNPVHISCMVSEYPAAPGYFDIWVCGKKMGATFHGSMQNAKDYAILAMAPTMKKLEDACAAHMKEMALVLAVAKGSA